MVHAGADITELFPPLGPIPAHVKGADITELFPKPPPPPLPPPMPPELLFPQPPPPPSEGVSTPAGDTPQPEKLEPPPPEALEVQDTPAELPGTASTPGGDTPQPEKPARPRRELIGDHVEVPIIEEKGELQDSQTRPRVYGQRGQELPAAARPKSGKVPRMGTPQGRPRGRGTRAEIRKFSRQVRRR